MTACSKCHKSIIFDINQMTQNGKFIPLDKTTKKPHVCEIRYVVDCNRCGSKITFENDFRNKNGKCIPIDAINGEPHRCKTTGLDAFFWS